jgi:hypothetical protein
MSPKKIKVNALNRLILVRGVPTRTPFETILRSEKEVNLMKSLLHSEGITDYSITPIPSKKKTIPIIVEPIIEEPVGEMKYGFRVEELDIDFAENPLLPFEQILADTTTFETEIQEKEFLIDYAKTNHGLVFTKGFNLATMYDRLQTAETPVSEKKESTILENLIESE